MYNRLQRSKRAVSGLIVAVLLVAVSLTIGGLVIGWISGYTSDSLDTSTKSQKQQDECFEIDYKVISVNANHSSSQLGRHHNFNVTIENKNTETIKGFLFKFIPDNGDSLVTISNSSGSTNITGYGRVKYSHFDLDSGQAAGFSKLEISPIIDVVVDTTIETVCSSKLKTIEKENFNDAG